MGAALALASGVAVLTWPTDISVPSSGLDASWTTALHMAAVTGMDHGREIVFTYGPLGFLVAPGLHFGSTAAAGLAFVTIVRIALVAAIITAFLPTRWWIGLVVAVAVGQVLPEGLVGHAELVGFLVLALCFRTLQADVDPKGVTWFPLVGGALAASALLMKFNSGAVAFGLTLVTTFALRKRWSDLALYLGSLVVALIGLAAIVRQSVTDIPAFLSNSLQIAAGYSAAMGLEESGRRWEFAAALLSIVGAAIVLFLATRTWVRPRKLAAFVIGVLFGFAAFKLGFVRHDGHSVGFFALMALVPFAFMWIPRMVIPGSIHVGLSLAFLLGALPGSDLSVSRFVDPRPSLEAFGRNLRFVFSSSAREAELAAARGEMRSSYQLDESLLNEVDGAGVHIEPIEAGVAWAYPELDWQPIPIFQTYSAYTPALDSLNAEALASARGPDVVLRAEPASAVRSAQIVVPAIDARDPDYESPAGTLAMLCHFREAASSGRWQVLRRVPDRCGAPERLDVVQTTVGTSVEVPPPPGPDHLVYARIRGVGRSVLTRLRAVIYKPKELYLVQNGVERHRVVAATLVNPLLMHVPPEADYSGPFALAPATSELQLVYGNDASDSGEQITVEFFSMQIDS